MFEEEKVQYTKAGKVRKRKPKKSNIYFTQETQDAIIQYVKETDDIIRNEIFNTKLNYAFYKLAENIIHTFKFYYTEVDNIEELKHEVVTVLLEKLHLYNEEKGKAYSYFGTIAKRYLIVYNDKNYKKLKSKADVIEVDTDKSITIDLINNSEIDLDEINVVDIFVEYVDSNLFKFFPKEKDAKVADAILELFRRRNTLDILSKKALYIYIREITDTTTPIITSTIKKLKSIYKKVLTAYLSGQGLPKI